jgi:dienelactone hydrolase
MRLAAFTVYVLVAAATLAAAQERPGADAATSSEQLATLPQTPGAKGDQQRHYFFAALPTLPQILDQHGFVLEIVSREYSVDPDRVYLMGHSMGGMGTYVLGRKYAERWAAIAPMSGTLADATYLLDRLTNVAVMLSAGSTETATVAAAQAQVEQMNKLGIVTGLWMEPDGTHGSMIAPTLPKVLDFFADKVRR